MDKTVLITGCSSGIGLATAKLFLKNNYLVYGVDVQACPEVLLKNILFKFFQVDIRNHQKLDDEMSPILHEKGLSSVVCNAGKHLYGTLESTSFENIQAIIDSNILGTIHTLKVCLPYLKKQTHSSIVLLGSDQSSIAKKNSALYGLSKAAIAHLAKSTALDYANYNIRVNCVCPGAIDTPLAQNAMIQAAKEQHIELENLKSNVQNKHPLGRLGRSDEVAQAIFFLCSPAASFITGTTLAVDGGYTAQ